MFPKHFSFDHFPWLPLGALGYHCCFQWLCFLSSRHGHLSTSVPKGRNFEPKLTLEFKFIDEMDFILLETCLIS